MTMIPTAEQLVVNKTSYYPLLSLCYPRLQLYQCVMLKAEQVFYISDLSMLNNWTGPKRRGLNNCHDVGRKINSKCHRIVSAARREAGEKMFPSIRYFICCASKSRDLIKESSVSLDVIVANFPCQRTIWGNRAICFNYCLGCCHSDL